MGSSLDRRTFLKHGAAASAGVAASMAQSTTGAEAKARTLPTIKLGSLEVSRLILGSNPFYGFAHQGGGLAKEMKEYYTDERIMAVLDEAASLGITAVASPVYGRWLKLFARYRERGGKLRTWIAQPDGGPEQMKEEITRAVKGGAGAVFVQGARVDQQFAQGNLARLREWVEHIRGLGVPAGMASHRPDVHLAAEKAKLPTDFYYQCFYNPSKGYRAEDREKAVAALRQVGKPVVGYKILAAGRLKAADGFGFAFRHLRPGDGVCVGMFPKHQPDQIQQNASLTRSLTVG